MKYGREVVRGAGGRIDGSVAIGGAGETSPEYIQNVHNPTQSAPDFFGDRIFTSFINHDFPK